MINPSLFFLFILLVIPGFFALQVFSAFITDSKNKDSFWDITYNSVIHSLFIYMFLYPIVYLLGIDIFREEAIIAYISSSKWNPLFIILAILGFSLIYGIAYALFYRFKVLKWILAKLFKRVVDPPNILADIIDTKYGTKPMEHWLTFKHDGVIYSGGLKLAKVDTEPKEVLLQDVQILDPETRDPLQQYPEDQFILVKIDNITIIELKSIPNQ